MKITKFKIVGIVYIVFYLLSVGLGFWVSSYVRDALNVPASEPLNYEFIFSEGWFYIFIGLIVFLYDNYKEKSKFLQRHQKLAFIIFLVPLVLGLLSALLGVLVSYIVGF